MWEPQFGLADAGWHIIAPHFRGMDGTSADAPVTSMDDYAGDVIDLLDSLHIEEAVVGGLSMGGYVAMAMLRLAPNYVRALILADTRPQADAPQALEGRKKLMALARERGAGAVADEMIPKLLGESTRRDRPEVVEQVRRLIGSNSGDAIAGAITALMTRRDSTPLLSSIHFPTLIVVGEEDAITPPALSQEMHGAIAGSALAQISGAGHLSNLERPDAFNAALAPFLQHRI
jgi:pimeloyl-ACP methyl ester carboxylesterase